MGSRYVDLGITVCVADVEHGDDGRPRWKPGSDEEIAKVGARWDRRKKTWSPRRPRSRLVIRFHRGQERAARWFAEWCGRLLRGDWTNYRRAWSALLIGGRRSGKTHFACAALIIFAVMRPDTIAWAISPTLETGAELDDNIRMMLPDGWYVRRPQKNGSTTYRLVNGSRLLLKSAVKPSRLKAGRVDICLLNESQELAKLAYVKLRAAVADRSGIVLMTANPPDAPIGRWVEEHYLKAKAGAIECEPFEFDPRANPWINYEALASMGRGEVDEKEYQRDVLGLFAPIGDIVFHAWDPSSNWRDPPPHLIDVTAEITRGEFGRAAAEVVGMDFQRTPEMVGIVCRFFRDPTDPSGDVLTWVIDEAVVPDADENELLDTLESIPRWRPGDGAPKTRTDRGDHEFYRGWAEPTDARDRPAHAAVVADASGFWQDGEHNDGRSSDKWLKARGWTHLFRPQRDSDRNPAIGERMKAGNARLKAADGKRRLFVALHCTRTAEALRLYEIKNGAPDRRSQFAHIADGVTYVVYRFFGRPSTKVARKAEYRALDRFGRAAQFHDAPTRRASPFGAPRDD